MAGGGGGGAGGGGIAHPAALKTGWPKWAIHFSNLHPYRLQMTIIANVNPPGQCIKSPRPFCLQPLGQAFKYTLTMSTQSQLGPPPFSHSVWDRKRAELICKSSTIHGGYKAKRRHLPLTTHEEGVNEAAFQLCLRDPTLLVRRDELFLLARRAVKKRGYMGGHGDQKLQPLPHDWLSCEI